MSSQPPSQAGKFKPKAPKKKKATSIKPPSSSSTATTAANERSSSNSRGGRGRGGRGSGSGRGTSPSSPSRGRGGRGRGRGRGRAPMPKGQVFFTGASALINNTGAAAAGGTGNANAKMAAAPEDNPSSSSDVIIMPGMSGWTTGSSSKAPSLSFVAGTATGRIAAAAQARQGEGDEIIVGEAEEGQGVGDAAKSGAARSILDREPVKNTMFFDDDDDDVVDEYAGEFTYDSDSSVDGEPVRLTQSMNNLNRGGKDRRRQQSVPVLPRQLPLPPTRRPGLDKIDYMYECQKINTESGHGQRAEEEEKKVDDIVMDDPPLEPPFLDLRSATAEQKAEEQKSMMIFKFPTRLPRLAPQSTLSGMAVKREHMMDIDGAEQDFGALDPPLISSMDLSAPRPDAVSSLSSSYPSLGNTGAATSNSTPSGQTAAASSLSSSSGYDDTLKDCAAGRYGKIVVHKSGQAYLIVGGGDPSVPPVRMQLSTGIPCGFLQQAVSIDTENGYIPLGEVKKSIVVTPDVENAFPSGR